MAHNTIVEMKFRLSDADEDDRDDVNDSARVPVTPFKPRESRSRFRAPSADESTTESSDESDDGGTSAQLQGLSLEGRSREGAFRCGLRIDKAGWVRVSGIG